MKLLDLKFNSSDELRATFEFHHPRRFHVYLSVRLNSQEGSDKALSEIVKIIESARHCSDYEHCPECNWSQLMIIARRCREEAQIASKRAAITISIEDRIVNDAVAEKGFLEKSFSYSQATIH